MKFSYKFADMLAGENGGWANWDYLVMPVPQKCASCDSLTHFVDICSATHLCSEECEQTFYDKMYGTGVYPVPYLHRPQRKQPRLIANYVFVQSK